MAKYQRIQGGEKNEKTGIDWTRSELEEVCDLYINLSGKNIHENNPKIHELAKRLNRTIRSVENQLLGFKKVATKDTGRKNYNRLIPLIWNKKNAKKTIKKTKNSEFQFRISSALKDIIGQDLITDDYIAIFELVKNSYDAYSNRVDIHFKNIYSEDGKIVIIDNGKGMDANDLKEKWLFVAYSAKKDGTEDDNFDYRNSIYKKRAFAGAKGIGRFSCDRLGRILYLETTKSEKNSKTEVLITDWGKFEEDSSEEFVNIGIEHFQKSKSDFGIKNGTVLEISELRSNWDRAKILILKSSLSKLINPSRDKGEQRFKIFIHCEEEISNDYNELNDKDKVNGEVKNFIFEELGLKTTKLVTAVSKDGKYVLTNLYDGGTLIYGIKEINKYELLDNIEIVLFYLNQAAKTTFHKRMGVSSIEYGHIFLYKNGFRIYPYGEPGEDPLGLDARKTQGVRRYFGTRELIGQIQIFSDTDQLKETSSRGDGLRKTDTYYQLVDFFWESLKRLENYVVKVQKWGLSIEGDQNLEVKERIASLIAKISNSKTILEFKYPPNFLELLESGQARSITRVIKNLKRIAIDSENDALLHEIEKTEKKLNEINKEKEEAEAETEAEKLKAAELKKELSQRISENLFLKSVKSQDLDSVVSFMHSIGISASTIDNYMSSTYQRIVRGMLIKQAELKKIIEITSFENRKILSITRFATKANFQLYTESITEDLFGFVKEYLENIVVPLRGEDINIQCEKSARKQFTLTFRPIEITILFDNFISNSIRAKAKNIEVLFRFDSERWSIVIRDDGIGIKDEILHRIFDFGFTTTSGSGLGLFHVMEVLRNLNATIIVNNKVKKGVEFTINF